MNDSDKQELQTKGLFPMDEINKTSDIDIKSTPPKSWWIEPSGMKDCPDGKTFLCRSEDPKLDGVTTQFVHVVEASALKAVQAELAEVQQHFFEMVKGQGVLIVKYNKQSALLEELKKEIERLNSEKRN